MCKKAYCLIVLLFSSAWAHAQQSQPGYAVLTPDPGSVRSGSSLPPASPPEPAPLGGLGGGGPVGMPYPQAPGGYLPGMGGPGMSYPPAMGGAGMGGPGMSGPGMSGPGMAGPNGYPPMMGGPGMAGPDGSPPGVTLPQGGYMGDSSLPIVGPTAKFGSETFWFNLGYAAGWLEKPRLGAALVTEGSPTDAHPGAFGQQGTVIAFGDNNYKFGTYHGIQASLGVNVNDQLYLELNSTVFPSQHVSATVASDVNGNPLISRPIFSTLDGQERSFLTSFPGVLAGSTNIQAHSELWGIEAVARYKFEITPYLTGDVLFGYRQMELVENLQINDTLIPLQPSITFLGNQVVPGQGTYLTDYDRFATNNVFNGVDFGGRLQWQSGLDWLAVNGFWKEALGATSQTVNISGATSLVTPAGTATVPGGILAQSTNGGNFSRTVFGSITDVGAGLVFTPCKYVRFEVGYTFTYWNSVVRPGNQISHSVTSTQVPTDINYAGSGAGETPVFGYKAQSLTMQTLNLGLSFYY